MKKIISVTLAVLMLSLCFVVSASAVPQPEEEIKYATFSEDFTIMFLEGKPYSRVNTSNIYFYEKPIYDEYDETDEFYDSYSTSCPVPLGFYEGKLSEEQKKTVDNISLYSSDSSEAIFEAEIYYKAGAGLSVSYLDNAYLKEYNQLTKNNFDEYYVDFTWPEGNTVAINKEVLSSQQTREFDLWDYYDTFTVEGAVKNGSLRYVYGEIRYINDEFYYYDPLKNKEAEEYFNIIDEYSYGYETEPKVTLNLITDEATKEALEAALQKYYQDDMGYIYNDELLEGVSKVFLTILFGVIPFGALISFVVLTIKAKKKTYRKIYVTGFIVSLAEIATFIAAAICLFK